MKGPLWSVKGPLWSNKVTLKGLHGPIWMRERDYSSREQNLLFGVVGCFRVCNFQFRNFTLRIFKVLVNGKNVKVSMVGFG